MQKALFTNPTGLMDKKMTFNMKYIHSIIYILIFAAVISCKKNYTPTAIMSSASYLVMEGVINSGSDSTFIKLSRTVNISVGSTAVPVTGAIVSVESDQNNRYPLTEIYKGTYAAPGLNLEGTKKYHLRVKTLDKKEYTSNYESVKNTPPIDSIGFTATDNKLQIYVNAHDDKNATHYYRWRYKETWRFHSEYYSQWMSDGKDIIRRPADKNIYTCFGNQSSSSIVLGSSAKLIKDVIYQNPVTYVVSSSEKIEDKYSIILYQYALTTDAYDFWVNLKKNTEQLGSIFDAQPSNINGNITNINDPADVVLGYISVSSVQSKRIFINKSQLPSSWVTEYPYVCHIDSEYYNNPRTHYDQVTGILIPLLPTSFIPVSDFYLPKAKTPSGFMGAPPACVDCTLRGTTVLPPFWK